MTVINYSEFNTLTSCERKWAYQYVLNEAEEGARKGLFLGTLCHKWHERRLLGLGATLPSEWTDDIEPGGKPGEAQVIALASFDPELVTRATWLAGRFVECYGAEPPSWWTVISAEDWMTREFTWGTLVGRTDGFVRIEGKLWLIELKTYGARPGPLAYAQVSPQLGCYSLLAEAKYGERPWGIIYQGVYTYRWKPIVPTQASLIEMMKATPEGGCASARDLKAAAKLMQADPNRWTERPAAESFDQIEVELGDEHLRTAETYLQSAVNRRDDLLEHGMQALPNVGRDCSWCSFKTQCWFDLGGVEPFEIEVDDDTAEPV